MCDAVYLNRFANIKKWYTPYKTFLKKCFFRLNIVTLTKVKLQTIKDVALPEIE